MNQGRTEGTALFYACYFSSPVIGFRYVKSVEVKHDILLG